MLGIPAYSAKTLNDFLCRLYTCGAVKIDTDKGFRLKLHDSNPTAPLSPLYFNLRVPANKGGPLNEMDVHEIADFFYHYLRNNSGLTFDAICPVPNAGDPFVKELQKIFRERNGWEPPVLELSKEETSGGRRVGELKATRYSPAGMVVLIIDDLISRSDSKAEAVESLRRAGCLVHDCLVFLDREQGGSRALAKMGVKLHAIASVSGTLALYKDQDLITGQQLCTILNYLQDSQ